MGKKRDTFKSYEQVLKQIEIQPDTDTVKLCKFCGELLYLIKINRLIAFWIHKTPEAIKKCGNTNTLHPGHPMIVQNMTFYKNVLELWNQRVEELKAK